jgi:hypothetical protein
MLLLLVLFALLTAGFCVPCLLDIASTPAYEIRSLSRRTWLALVVLLSVFGAIGWLLLGRPGGRLTSRRRDAAWLARPGPQEALRRHPAGRSAEPGYGPADDQADSREAGFAAPMGPDDDEEFLRALERQIRRSREDW